MAKTDQRDLVKDIAVQCLKDEMGIVSVVNPEDIQLLGSSAVCDSLGLVVYLLSLEESVNSKFGSRIVLTSEHAMSQSRSPFRTLGTLIDYIAELLPNDQ